MPERVKIPQKNTFHPDRRAITSPNAKGQNFKALDVSAFVTDMSEALSKYVEEAKSNDPKELKKEIAKLKKALSENKTAVEVERVEIPVINSEDLQTLRDTLRWIDQKSDKILEIGDNMKEFAQIVGQALSGAEEFVKRSQKKQTVQYAQKESKPSFRTNTLPASYTPTPAVNGNSEFSIPQQRILDACRMLANINISQPLRTMVAFLSNQSPRSSGFKNNLGYLRSQGTIEYVGGDRMALTTAGFEKTKLVNQPLTVDEFQQIVLRQLPMPQARILQVLIDAEGAAVLRSDVAEQAGQSFTSSGYKNNLGSLRSLGLIDYAGSDSVKALPIMFLE
jgi:hypothetical protein